MQQEKVPDNKKPAKSELTFRKIFHSLSRRITYAYYRTAYIIKYEWRLKEFAFINYWLLGSLFIFIASFYLFLNHGEFYVTIPDLTTELYISENILRTVSIFVGIVFSFIVLSFNIFYRYFGRFAFLQFFTSKYIKFIFTLFISDIIILLYTCGYLKECTVKDVYGDCLFIISTIVSLILVLSIIPTLILLLRSSQNRDNILQLIRKFNKEWHISYHVNVLWQEGNENTHLQRDPINLLIEIGTAAIKDFDRTSILTIKSGCMEHLKKLHADYQMNAEFHPDEFYDKLSELTRNLYPVAIKERNETAALIIVNLQFEIEEFYIKNFKDFNSNGSHEHHYDGIRFMVVMKEFFLKALQFNEDGISDHIIACLRKWWSFVITVYLPGISYDYPEKERFHSDQTSFFITSTYYEFYNVFELLFTYKKLLLFKEAATFFGVLNAEIVASKNTRNTSVYLLQWNGLYSQQLFEKFIDLTESSITSKVYPFAHGTSQEMIHIRSHIPLQYELRAFEYLLRKNKLNAFVINEIKALAFHAMQHFSEDGSFKKALLLIIRKFDHLRSLISGTATTDQKETYLLLERYLRYILEWTPKYSITDEEVLSELNSALGKFEFKERFTNELNGIGYLIRDIR